jgi:hypothetical protein
VAPPARASAEELSERAAQVASTLVTGAAASGWRGPDPFDGLWWHWPSFMVSGKRRRQAIIQLHARSPFDIRRIYRREHSRIAKTLGLCTSAAVRLWALDGDPNLSELALRSAATLDANRDAGDDAWGYPWDTQTRWSFYPAGSPNVVATAYAAHGLQDAAEQLDEERFGERARRAAAWVSRELWLPDARAFGYHPGSSTVVHNASLHAAALVKRLLPDDPRAEEAVATSLSAQRPDGSWPYGAGAENLGFVDSFHTGYVLCSLLAFDERDEVRRAVESGARYYVERFFDPDGRAQLWPNRPYPVDGHSAGTAMTTLTQLTRRGYIGDELLRRVAARTLQEGVKNGHAVHRRGRYYRSTVRYVRWCDGHIALGLADAAGALRGLRSTAPGAHADRSAG